MKKEKAILFGPFFGELSWEYFRFSPFAIYSKKVNPDAKIIVLTRSERFDFYGKWADILIPLKIKDDESYNQKAFKLVGFDIETCNRISDIFKIQYKKHFLLLNHFVPDYSSLRYNLKWQFPRDKMDYDFRPRRENYDFVRRFVKKNKSLIIDDGYNYNSLGKQIMTIDAFKRMVNEKINRSSSITYYGCLILLIKHSKFVISDINSHVGRLSLLLRTPLIYPNRDVSDDSLKLLNPYDTPVIDCENLEEGINIYENII